MKKITLLITILLITNISWYGNAQFIDEGFEGSFPPADWLIVNNGTGNDWTLNTSSTYANTGSQSAEYSYDSSNPADTWLFSKSVTLTANETVNWSFYVRDRSFTEKLKLTVGSAQDVASQSTVLIDLNTGADISGTFEIKTGTFTASSAGDYYFAFNCYSDADQFDLFVDDFLVETPPTCPEPNSLAVANITETTADLSWSQGGSETNWEYSLLLASDPAPTSGTSTSMMSFDATSLSSNTDYVFYLRADCGGGDTSTWISTPFTTLATPPSNDSCLTPTNIVVTADGNCSADETGTNLGATDSGEATTTCAAANYAGGDIWYEFTVPTGVTEVLYSRSASDFSTTYMALYSGSCGSLTELFCSTGTSVNLTGLTSGETYLLRLFDWGNNDFGDVTFCLAGIPSSFTPDYINDFSTYPGIGWSESEGPYGAPDLSDTASTWAIDDYGNDTGHANGKSARIELWSTTQNEYLITPTFDLSGGTFYMNFDIALTVWNSTAAATLDADDYVALLVTEDGTTWSELTRWDSNSTIATSRQPITEIELTGYGATTKFAFFGFSDTSGADNNFYVDNFQITNYGLSVEENVIEGFSLYPNPVNDRLHLTALDNIEELSVYNLLGQEVLRTQPKVLTTEIDMTNLPTGMYVVKVKVGEQLGSYRIVKE